MSHVSPSGSLAKAAACALYRILNKPRLASLARPLQSTHAHSYHLPRAYKQQYPRGRERGVRFISLSLSF